ncbi:flippase [Phormidium sp. FACHB-592]|uniref:Flippase n=1 Tax=Stenomitos frigidus AS-A4 TaxID=2933935 RepID=A0ABV0KDE2_9CYAN|nr:flippase [Phormidium sp. FACHB-592]MBD2077879.1 flippase [Phormidium sp. FACHB-592]
MNQAWIQLLPPILRSKLHGRHTLQKILSNTGWLFADRILRMGVGLLVGVWVARYLGPEQFGLFNYAIAFVSLFSVIPTLGLDSIVIREIVHHPEQKHELLGTAFTLKLVSGIAIWLVTIGVIAQLNPGQSLTHWLVGVIAAGMVFQSLDTIDFWFQSQVQSKYTVYAKNIAFVCTTFVKVWLLMIKAPLIAFAWVGLAETALGSLGLVIAYRANGELITAWRSRLITAKKLLGDSYPLILSSLAIMVYMRIDQLMLAQQVGNQEVGIYSAAVRLAEVWYFIPMAIVSSTFPSIMEARQISETIFYERLQKLYRLMALLAYTVAIPTTFLAEPIIKLLFGATYEKASPMLAILIWTGLFVNLGVARSSFLTVMNWTKLHLLTVLLGCGLNIILNYILIPSYGGIGSAIATFTSYLCATYLACFLHKSLFKTGSMLTKAMFLIG